jgi:hypothetical protein
VTFESPVRKRAILREVKEIDGSRGGVLMYAAQEIRKVDAQIAGKGRFRTETI